MSRHSVLQEDMEDEEAGKLDCSESIMSRDENTLLGESISNNKNGCIAS